MIGTATLKFAMPFYHRRHTNTGSRSSCDVAARRERAVTAMQSWIEVNLPRFMPAAAIQAGTPIAALTDLALTLFLIVNRDSPVYGTPVDAWARHMANRIFARLPDPSVDDINEAEHAFPADADPVMLAPLAALAEATRRAYVGRDMIAAYVENVVPGNDLAAHIARAVLGLPCDAVGLWPRMDNALEQMRVGDDCTLSRTAASDLQGAALCLTQFGVSRGQTPLSTKSALRSATQQANEFLSCCAPESAADILLSQTWACETLPDFHTMHKLIAQISPDGSVNGHDIRQGIVPADFNSKWAPTLAVFRAAVLCAPSQH